MLIIIWIIILFSNNMQKGNTCQGGPGGPALLRNLLVCLFLQSNIFIPFYYIKVTPISPIHVCKKEHNS